MVPRLRLAPLSPRPAAATAVPLLLVLPASEVVVVADAAWPVPCAAVTAPPVAVLVASRAVRAAAAVSPALLAPLPAVATVWRAPLRVAVAALPA